LAKIPESCDFVSTRHGGPKRSTIAAAIVGNVLLGIFPRTEALSEQAVVGFWLFVEITEYSKAATHFAMLISYLVMLNPQEGALAL
jgi:hypothetical protein